MARTYDQWKTEEDDVEWSTCIKHHQIMPCADCEDYIADQKLEEYFDSLLHKDE